MLFQHNSLNETTVSCMLAVVVECTDTKMIRHLSNVREGEKVRELMFLDRYDHRFDRVHRLMAKQMLNPCRTMVST